MSDNLRCGDPAALAGFIYDECTDGERARMLAHLADCAVCTAEVAAIQRTRTVLTEWQPPSVELGFEVTAADLAPPVVAFSPRSARPTAPPRWWHWASMPVWGQAAAAVALFAVGAMTAAVMNIEVRRDQAGITVRTGWFQSAPPAGQAPVTEDAALQEKIREEVRRVHAEADGGRAVASAAAAPVTEPVVAQTATGPSTSGDTLRQVRALLAESEQRQQRELALRVSQMVRDVDSQRRADIAKIERTVSPMEGVTTEELQQQRRMLNYLISVSQTK